MVDRFLSAKHWQLFTLMFGIPFLLQMLMMGQMLTAVSSGSPDSFQESGGLYISLSLFVFTLYMAIFYGWMWSIGTGLQSKISSDVKMKVGRFKVFLIFPLIYMFGAVTAALLFITNLPENINPFFLATFFILHFFAIFCIFYSFYFTAKTIKTAEQQEEVSFGDFAGEFFLLWFYPIGIWFIQPRVNKIHAREEEQGIEEHLVS